MYGSFKDHHKLLEEELQRDRTDNILEYPVISDSFK